METEEKKFQQKILAIFSTQPEGEKDISFINDGIFDSMIGIWIILCSILLLFLKTFQFLGDWSYLIIFIIGIGLYPLCTYAVRKIRGKLVLKNEKVRVFYQSVERKLQSNEGQESDEEPELDTKFPTEFIVLFIFVGLMVVYLVLHEIILKMNIRSDQFDFSLFSVFLLILWGIALKAPRYFILAVVVIALDFLTPVYFLPRGIDKSVVYLVQGFGLLMFGLIVFLRFLKKTVLAEGGEDGN
jgi:hypothetical protein